MTAALITIYYPTAAAAKNVANIARQVDQVYLCDNSPADNGTLFRSAGENVRYIRFGENLGLSAAFNRILQHPAIPWEPEDYVIFFDQDSRIGPGHIASLQAVFENLRRDGHRVGCLGPVFFNTSSGQRELPRMRTALGLDAFAVSGVITSSMLCRYGDLQAIGFWNESVFLDMADWDLCWRFQAAGMCSCMTEAVVFQHSVGSGEKKIGPLRLRVGKPFREYYQIRDCLKLLWKPYTPLKYRLRFLAMVFVRTPLHLLFLDHRRARLRYAAKGIGDYFRNKRGALEEQQKTAAKPHT